MREIEFRGWRRKYQEWMTGYLVVREEPYLHDIIQPIGNNSSVTGAVERDSVGQFTGLLDKNGTEIYEGDILKRDDFPDEPPQYIVRFGKFTDSHDMYYRQEYLGWYVDEIGRQDEYRNPLTYIVDMLDGVVCGNIYEHPHLSRGDND